MGVVREREAMDSHHLTSCVQPLAMSLSLNCLIDGEVQEKMFTVKILETENVSILKDLIKEKKARHLNHVDASDLDLWKVDLRLDDLGAEVVHGDPDGTDSKLSSHRKLSSLFNDLVDDKRLHIIAKAPGMSH